MLTRGKLERGVVEMVDTESLVPPDHLLRKIDAAVDFGKLYELVKRAGRGGRRAQGGVEISDRLPGPPRRVPKPGG